MYVSIIAGISLKNKEWMQECLSIQIDTSSLRSRRSGGGVIFLAGSKVRPKSYLNPSPSTSHPGSRMGLGHRSSTLTAFSPSPMDTILMLLLLSARDRNPRAFRIMSPLEDAPRASTSLSSSCRFRSTVTTAIHTSRPGLDA